MHELALPSGLVARFNVTGRPGIGLHRWYVRIRETSSGLPRLSYGSQIGGSDLHQRVEVPPQNMDCHMSIGSTHRTKNSWADDHLSVWPIGPSETRIGFCQLLAAGSRPDDVTLSFEFTERR